MLRKKSKVSIIISLFCILFSSSSWAEDKWFGLLTVDKFPVNNCAVVGIEPMHIAQWTDNASPKELYEMRIRIDNEFSKAARGKGFNAVLGYTATFSGGSHSFSNTTYIGGILSNRGVLAKVKCK